MSQVIDLNVFRQKKQQKKTDSSPNHTADFGDRLSRIKASIDKINSLMAELKKISTSELTK